jgi:hypothetical protein
MIIIFSELKELDLNLLSPVLILSTSSKRIILRKMILLNKGTILNILIEK